MEIKVIAALILGPALCAPTMAQEHAPLLATCEADVALWYDRDESTTYLNAQTAFWNDKTPNTTALNRLSLKEVIARHEEMGKCFTMTNRQIYYDANTSYMGVYHDRVLDFMHRHKLMGQLMAEDAAGKR